MQKASLETQQPKKVALINVAVAVIHYGERYLLGFRNAAQHQGNLYEFVGGKIEPDERAEQALIREVAEETGISLNNNMLVKLGRLHHDYGDKHVSLQVYKIELTDKQFEYYKHHSHGLEGQALTWVYKSQLLAGQYPLPAANKTILDWLSVPTKIAITHPLAHFEGQSDPESAWLQYHQEKLPPDSWSYIRVKHSDTNHFTKQLLDTRPDILAIVPHDNNNGLSFSHPSETGTVKPINPNVVAKHLTHSDLLAWLDSTQTAHSIAHTLVNPLGHSNNAEALPTDCPLIVSCHDVPSIEAANQLAKARLHHKLPPVIGAFLSPVLPTQTHPDTPPLGWEAWADLAELADMPVIGLGGLSPAMAGDILPYGGIGVAGICQFHQ